jgi:hypothetical protein
VGFVARRAAWLAGGLCGAAVATALSLYALGLEMSGADVRDARALPVPRHDVEPAERVAG